MSSQAELSFDVREELEAVCDLHVACVYIVCILSVAYVYMLYSYTHKKLLIYTKHTLKHH